MRPIQSFLFVFWLCNVPIQLHSTNSNLKYQNSIETFSGKYNEYEFKVAKGLFKRIKSDLYYCSLYNAFIEFHHNVTYYFDESGFFRKSDLVKQYKNGILPTLLIDKENWFVLSGFNKKREIVYYKGFYNEFYSMQGRETGKLSWLWSRSGIIEIRYDEKYKKELDPIISLINKSFRFDLVASFEREMNR
jgi:hypothetical protein